MANHGLDKASNDYSVFNTISNVSMMALAYSKDDEDVSSWVSKLKKFADKNWGPAFSIVMGGGVRSDEIEGWYTGYIEKGKDNDIIMAQRPKHLADNSLAPDKTGGPNFWLLLDYVILKAVQLLWN